jgi:Fe-S cluster biogenesis protein NfuA
MKEKIDFLIKNEINPVLADHKGGCELVSIEGETANIRLLGGCVGCPGRKHTFGKNVIPFLIENVQGLKQVNLVD